MTEGVDGGLHTSSEPPEPTGLLVHSFPALVCCGSTMPTRRHVGPNTELQAAPKTSPATMARHCIDSEHVDSDAEVVPKMRELVMEFTSPMSSA